MKIVFFAHPDFMPSLSMPRFTNMLKNGMLKRQHEVSVWKPKPRLFHLPLPSKFKKWLGYVDQYIIFPIEIKIKLIKLRVPVLFVFIDQALGPWVPYVKNKPHVIHCHDFLAQFSATDLIKENKTSWSGRIYQSFIRKGYRKGKNFISVSRKTQDDLHKTLDRQPHLSTVVYNGLNNDFKFIEVSRARKYVGDVENINLDNGYLLHVGGNQWYKNRVGVIKIYEYWRRNYADNNIPLLLVGPKPDQNIYLAYHQSPYKDDILISHGRNDEFVKMAYVGASLLVYPSLAEGFGWPIAEAMASGCLVLTTKAAPMTEVAADAAFFIKKMPEVNEDYESWLKDAAGKIDEILKLSSHQQETLREAGFVNIKRFDPEKSLDEIEKIYKRILIN